MSWGPELREVRRRNSTGRESKLSEQSSAFAGLFRRRHHKKGSQGPRRQARQGRQPSISGTAPTHHCIAR